MVSSLPSSAEGTGRHVPHLSMHSPIGDITIFEHDGAIVALDWGWVPEQSPTALLTQAKSQLDAYMFGQCRAFDLPLGPVGTAYQQAVWRALRDIPFGEVRSYQAIARVAGGSARSVGQANGRNPIPIIIPCHRVVAESHIGGYSGGDGLPTKVWLLNLENPQYAFFAPSAPNGDMT
jgi:methylated-DNA-[protein]-cysteine S-methyltransferase